jgi:hypothetical protein
MKQLSSSTQCQKNRLIEYLQKNTRITTPQARADLDIMMPAARLFDLKVDGFNIVTNRMNIDGHRKVAEYVLLSGAGEPS